MVTTIEAIRTIVECTPKSARTISVEIGKSANWLSATLNVVSDTKAGTLARIAEACGYRLQLVSDDGKETITIDPAK